MYYVKCDPKNPNKKLNPQNPTWEVQIRTEDVNIQKKWKEIGLKPKGVIPETEGEKPYWKVNIQRRMFKHDGSPSECPQVLNGSLKPIDPRTVGNGSIGNIQIYQYENKGATGGLVSVLMGIQVIKHTVYTPKERNPEDQFTPTTTEVVNPGTVNPDDDIPF